MKSDIKFIMAVASLAFAALACQAVAGGGSNNMPETPGVGKVILSDDFSSSQWGTGTDSDRSVQYVNEALQMILYKKNFFVWSPPNDKVYENIHMEVTVINNGTDSTTAIGLMCNKSAGNNFYYFAITPAGQYAIALAREGAADVFLTNNDEWADSDLIPVNADSYRMGADCGNSVLTLYVDGQEIVSVDNPSYTAGRVAVFTWSGEDASSAEVTFDNFIMTKLE